MKRNALKIVLIVWIALWGWFLVRELFVKNNLRDYGILLSRDLEGKHAYVTGDRLYEFLVYCNNNMPPDAGYSITGIDAGALERRRAVYYLYPRVEKENPGFILDLEQLILKKTKE